VRKGQRRGDWGRAREIERETREGAEAEERRSDEIYARRRRRWRRNVLLALLDVVVVIVVVVVGNHDDDGEARAREISRWMEKETKEDGRERASR